MTYVTREGPGHPLLQETKGRKNPPSSAYGLMSIDDMSLNMGVIRLHERRRFSREVRDKLARLSHYKCENCGRRIALGADDLLMLMYTGHVVVEGRCERLVEPGLPMRKMQP